MSGETIDPVDEGLRERKKRQTRDAILVAARRLFVARGFENVTVAEVARAADVSEKTVFNHFSTKEDLVVAGREERRAALIAAIRDRPPETSIIEPFRALTTQLLDAVEAGETEEMLAVPRMIRDSPTLQKRLFLGWEEEAAILAPVVAESVGAPPNDLVAAMVARTLAWAHRLVFREAFRRLLAGEDEQAVVDDLRAEADRVYGQLADGLDGYGR